MLIRRIHIIILLSLKRVRIEKYFLLKKTKSNVGPGRAPVASFASTAGERITPSTLTPNSPQREKMGRRIFRCHASSLHPFSVDVKPFPFDDSYRLFVRQE
jgi:hypothetical protein